MLLALLLGCGGDAAVSDSAASGCVSEHGLTWDGWGEGFMTTYCRACHSATSPDRRDAPEGVDFDTLDDVLQWRERIEVRVIEEESMPVGGGILTDDLTLLADFLACPEPS